MARKPGGCLGIALILIGACMAFLFGLGLLGAIIADDVVQVGAVIVLLVFTLGGLALIWLGIRSNIKKARLRAYLDLILYQRHNSIERISLLVKQADRQKVMTEIQWLINQGYLAGFALEPVSGLITQEDPDELAPKPKRVKFKCRACGAANDFETIDGPLSCQYCGAPFIGK